MLSRQRHLSRSQSKSISHTQSQRHGRVWFREQLLKFRPCVSLGIETSTIKWASRKLTRQLCNHSYFLASCSNCLQELLLGRTTPNLTCMMPLTLQEKGVPNQCFESTMKHLLACTKQQLWNLKARQCSLASQLVQVGPDWQSTGQTSFSHELGNGVQIN